MRTAKVHAHMRIRGLARIFVLCSSRKHTYIIKPHFYIVNLGFTGVYIIFLISAQKHRLWVLVRTEAVLTNTHNLCFEAEI